MPIDILTINTKPIDGQKPGTSGLRVQTTVAEAGNFLPNFIQATFDACGKAVQGCTLVLGGDGRYFNKIATQVILKMAAANGVSKVIVGRDGLLCTPAASAVIRARKTYGGFILTASHNPGGPNGDWGVKFNCANGGPAPESLTDAIYANTQNIAQYKIAAHVTWPGIDLSKIGKSKIDSFEVEVVDPIADYADLLKSIFDFEVLKGLVSRPNFKLAFDGMHAVTGPYAKAILVDMLGADPEAIFNAVPKEDFGGARMHPDPNMTYATELRARMGIDSEPDENTPDFGAASDGDGDRNMIIGKGFFVSPSDSVAVIAANATACIPYFSDGLKGLARSMPTSAALDKVAAALGVECCETPTGWKYFGSLLDDGKCSICGEESFGQGADHLREKDGMWAVLAWLSIIASKNKDVPLGEPLLSVEEIVKQHWAQFGRNYYTRYDYEGVDSAKATEVVNGIIGDFAALKGKEFGAAAEDGSATFTVENCDEFSYTDPVTEDIAEHQGVRLLAANGSRIVFRVSGTGSSAATATLRMYIEKFVGPVVPADGEETTEPAPASAESEEATLSPLELPTADALEQLVGVALEISKIPDLLGVEAPTVIT